MPTPRMRTAEGLLLMVKQDDPDTAVTLRMIRRLIATGELSHIDVGRKKLADYNELMDYLKGDQQHEKQDHHPCKEFSRLGL